MSILDFVGNTPTVELWPRVYAKLEMKNPSGSVKDRAAKAIVGNVNLPFGSRIVEATSGNFGISLALISAVMGYSLTVVMPDGEILELGAKVAKNSSGYSLKDLVIGSEGTICIITEATLKLVPLPKCTTSLLVPFKDMKSAIEAVPKIISS